MSSQLLRRGKRPMIAVDSPPQKTSRKSINLLDPSPTKQDSAYWSELSPRRKTTELTKNNKNNNPSGNNGPNNTGNTHPLGFIGVGDKQQGRQLTALSKRVNGFLSTESDQNLVKTWKSLHGLDNFNNDDLSNPLLQVFTSNFRELYTSIPLGNPV